VSAVAVSNLPHTPSRWACDKIGFNIVGVFLFFIVVLLPFAVTSVFSDIADPQSHHVYSLTPAGPQAITRTNLHLDVVGVDEWAGKASIRVSGHHTCDAACNWSDRILLVSIPTKSQDGEGLPPAQAILVPPGPTEVSQTIKLPVAGDPIRYLSTSKSRQPT